MSNLSNEERDGLKSLKKKVTDTTVLCYQTDKSGRWSCDTKDNYKMACHKHLSDPTKTEVISLDEHDRAEREMNSHGYALLRMMGLKGDAKGKRIRRTMKSTNNALAPFYCLRKDHKKVEEGCEAQGPKTRPLCGATDCLTRRTSFLLSKLLVDIIPPDVTQCNATEELIQETEQLNKRTVDKNWIVCSLDVEALYPSLDIKECARVIEERMLQSNFEVEGLRWTEISLYLKYHLSDEEIQELQLSDYCPIRTTKFGRPPTFVASGSDPDIDKRLGPWEYKNITPTDEEKKRMFCLAIKIMIEKTMSLHDYVFNGKIIRQKGGGSIGLDLTGVVADIYMCHWDKLYLQKLSEENIQTKLYKRYKDDIDLVIENEKENGKDQKEKENNTLRLCMELADSIHPSIKVTGDIPTNYSDNKLPILDLKVWIGEVQPGIHKIITSHYMKDVSTRAVINSRSSHPIQMKKNVMVNETMRILRNCNKFCPWEEVAGHVSYFTKRLQFSGYDQQFRFEVVQKALKKYEQTKTTENSENHTPKTKEKKNWYSRDNKTDAVMFVQATKDEALKKEVQRCAEKHKIKLKIVEKVENNVRKELQKSNPFKLEKCGREKCMICKIETGVNCRARGCVYEMLCSECERRYRGQTGNSVQERINQHFEDWTRKLDTSPLFRHSQLHHQGKKFPVRVKILKNCFGDPTTRKITEAVLIDELSSNDTMNGKNEWTYVKLNKLSMRQ